LGRELALVGQLGQRGLELRGGGRGRALADVVQVYGMPGQQRDLHDADAHHAGADHGDGTIAEQVGLRHGGHFPLWRASGCGRGRLPEFPVAISRLFPARRGRVSRGVGSTRTSKPPCGRHADPTGGPSIPTQLPVSGVPSWRAGTLCARTFAQPCPGRCPTTTTIPPPPRTPPRTLAPCAAPPSWPS